MLKLMSEHHSSFVIAMIESVAAYTFHSQEDKGAMKGSGKI
jgi:hypothetical protein